MNILALLPEPRIPGWLLIGIAIVAATVASSSSGAPQSGQAYRIGLVGDQDSGPVATVMASLEQALSETCSEGCPVDLRLSRLDVQSEIADQAQHRWDLIVTVGSRAAQRVAQSAISIPTLYAFLPEAAWHSLSDCCIASDASHTALFIDQPVWRHLILARLIDPAASRVGVLLGEISGNRRAALIESAEWAGFELHIAQVESAEDIGPKLRQLVKQSDVILALPDPDIYNRKTIYSILLTSYSVQVPVIGYSRAMAEAGAAAAVHATPELVGREIARYLYSYWQTGSMPAAGFGKLFSVTTNRDVMRSLRLRVQTEDALQRLMERESP